MKIKTGCAIASIFLMSCAGPSVKDEAKPNPMIGTWQLLTGTLIQNGDTTNTDYTKNTSFIKIINNTHFAFFQHDLDKGKEKDSAVFVAGGGRYSLDDSLYTEHLEYCNARQWEGNAFKFTISIKGDTLISSGVEKVESANVDRINIEKYVRIKK